MGDLDERIEEVNNAMSELQLLHTYLQKQYELALRRHEVTSAALSPAEQADALADLQQTYAAQGRDILDQLELQELTLASLQEELALRQIRAPFSGVVSWVSIFEEGDISSRSASVITLVNSTLSLFDANTEHWERFRPGDDVQITVKEQTYRAIVADAADLGLESAERISGKKADMYFILDDPAFSTEGGKLGTIMLVLSEHLDVIYLPTAALSASGGQPIVYYQREDGMKAINRETGLTIVIVAHDPLLAKKVHRVVAIRDGKISSERIMKQSYLNRLQDIDAFTQVQEVQNEYAILDRAGRLQSPREMLEKIDHTGNRLKVSLQDGRIILDPPGES